MQRLLYFTQENSSYFYLALLRKLFLCYTPGRCFEGLASGQEKVTNLNAGSLTILVDVYIMKG